MALQSVLRLTTLSGYNYTTEGHQGESLLIYNNGDLIIETQIQQIKNYNISYMFQTRIKTKYGAEIIINNETLDIQSENGNIPYELKDYKPTNYVHNGKIILPGLFLAKRLTIGLLSLILVKLNDPLIITGMKLEGINNVKDAHGALVYINDIKWFPGFCN